MSTAYLDAREVALVRLANAIARGADLRTAGEHALAAGVSVPEIVELADLLQPDASTVAALVDDDPARIRLGPWDEQVDVIVGGEPTVVARRRGIGIPLVLATA